MRPSERAARVVAQAVIREAAMSWTAVCSGPRAQRAGAAEHALDASEHGVAMMWQEGTSERLSTHFLEKSYVDNALCPAG